MEYVVVGGIWDCYGRAIADELGAGFLPVDTQHYKAGEIKPRLVFKSLLNELKEDDLDSKKILIALRDDRFEGDSNRYLLENRLTVDCIRGIESENNIDVSGIDVLMPYMYYARQDERFKPEEPSSLEKVAEWISIWDIDRLFTYHSHLLGREEKNLQMYFDVDVHDVSLAPLFANRLKFEYGVKDPIIVNPDGVSKTRLNNLLRQFEDSLFGWVLQDRDRATGKKKVVEYNIPEEVNLGYDVVIVDDLTDSGGTLIRAFEELENFNPSRVFILVSHMFDEEPVKRLGELANQNPEIEAIITSDSFASDYNTEAGKYFIENFDELTTSLFIADYMKKI
jgi:phosphoribosylpyrophosphate synthetase